MSIRYGQKKPLGSGNKREKSNGQNSKTQDGKVAAETRDAETRDAQKPSARRNAARRIGQAPRRTQGATPGVVAGKSHCRMFAAGGSQRMPPAETSLLTTTREEITRPRARFDQANPPENTGKMCACSNTLTVKPKNISRFLNVTVNKSTDIVQGRHVRGLAGHVLVVGTPEDRLAVAEEIVRPADAR